MSGKVKDGTPCSPHRNDVCIDGICEVRGHFHPPLGVQSGLVSLCPVRMVERVPVIDSGKRDKVSS